MSAAAGNPARQDPVRNVNRRRIRVWVHPTNGHVLPGGHLAAYTSSYDDKGALTERGNEFEVYVDDLDRIRKLVEPEPERIAASREKFLAIRQAFLADRQREETKKGSDGSRLKWKDVEKDWPSTHPINWVDQFKRDSISREFPLGRGPRPIVKLEVDDVELGPPQSPEERRMQNTVAQLATALSAARESGERPTPPTKR